MGHSAGHDIDPPFYRSPADAISAPREQLAYVVAFDRAGQLPDALEAWRGLRVHQVRLGGGDASSDSYCYRS